MYLLLLGFGVVLGAAGIVLAAAGVSVREGSFDTGLVTPGIVSAVGGLLLVGLGLALRVLQRIEQALAARVMPRVVPGQIVGAGETSGHVGGPALFPLPSETISAPSPPAAARAGDDQPASAGVEKLSEAARAGNRPSPPSPKIAVSAVDETKAEADPSPFAKRGNGAAAARISPRLPMAARFTPAAEPPKAPAFDSFWPKGARSPQPGPVPTAAAAGIESLRSAEQIPRATADTSSQSAAVQNADIQAAAMQAMTAQAASTRVAADDGAAVPISVLKSGVVDGMAYTLYSDGSIEAQLPQGTLRFGSITELRHHLEQSA